MPGFQGRLSALLLRVDHSRKVATAIDDALDANDITDHTKQDRVAPKSRQPGGIADIRAQLVEQGIALKFGELVADVMDKESALCALSSAM